MAVHPSSINARENHFESKFLVFAEKVCCSKRVTSGASRVAKRQGRGARGARGEGVKGRGAVVRFMCGVSFRPAQRIPSITP